MRILRHLPGRNTHSSRQGGRRILGLTGKQRAAAERTGQDICVVAGPGSGKTRVLIERIRWLVDRGLSPRSILALTFTEKAAKEIKARLVKSFADRPDLRADIELSYVSTIHALCARLLREHAIAAGLDPEFSILDEADCQAELQKAAHTALDRVVEERPEPFGNLLDVVCPPTELAGSLIKLYEALRISGKSVSDLRQASGARQPSLFQSFVSELQQELRREGPGDTHRRRERSAAFLEWAHRASRLPISPVTELYFRALDELSRIQKGNRPGDPAYECVRRFRDREHLIVAELVTEHYGELRSLLVDAVEETDRLYRRRKLELSTLDFSDLEEKAIALLRRDPDLRARVRAGFPEILMDELQDTNQLQWQLVNLLRTDEHFFAVGDINQSIYGFRHADPGLFRGYRTQVETGRGRIDELYDNHRSREEILATVQLIAGRLEGIEPHTLKASRAFPPKTQPSVEVVAVTPAPGAKDPAATEARWIARRIRELVGTLAIEVRKADDEKEQRPASYRDMAVLVRTFNALPALQNAFTEFGIPHLTAGGKFFYEAREVQDLTHLLRVLANPRDEIALASVLRSPMVGIGDETLLRLRLLSPDLATALLKLDGSESESFATEDLERLRLFREQLEHARARRDDVLADRLLARILDGTDYEEGLDSRACANIDKFLALVRKRRWLRPGPIEDLLEDLEWRRAMQREPEAPPEASSDVVRLMSVHQAKGLQSPIVFLPALHRGSSTEQPPICLSPSGHLGARWRNPATGKDVSDWDHLEYRRREEERARHEENRLLYVAMTRAEEHLVLSFANTNHAMRNWAGKVVAGLDFDPGVLDMQPVLHTPPSGAFPILLWRTNASPEVLSEPPGAEVRTCEPVLLGKPAVSGQHDSTAPVTSLALFETCPRRYYLGRYLGARGSVRRPPAPRDEDDGRNGDETDLGAAELGRQVHALLAGKEMEGANQEVRELAARFLSSELGLRAGRARRVEREFDFVMSLEDIVLRGQIDLWFEEGVELVLVDYKTDDIPAAEAARRAEAYGIQVRLYALALGGLAGRLPDAAWLYYLRPNVAVRVSLDEARLEAARESVRAFRSAQHTLRFPLREGEHCFRCEFYRGPCPAGRK